MSPDLRLTIATFVVALGGVTGCDGQEQAVIPAHPAPPPAASPQPLTELEVDAAGPSEVQRGQGDTASSDNAREK